MSSLHEHGADKAHVSRRAFLGAAALGVGATSAALAGSAVLPKAALAADNAVPEEWANRHAVLFDSSKCIGCHYCEAGCKKANGLPCDVQVDISALEGTVFPAELLPMEMVYTASKVAPVKADDRTAERWLRVVQVAGTAAEGEDGFMRHSCTHCGLCSQVCPARALVRRSDGIVEVHPDRCIGCKYCYQACPFDVPRFVQSGDDRAMRKCDMCAARVDGGGMPACVQSCPAGALQFGTLADMAARGSESVAALQGAGDEGAYLYGERELGGIGVLLVMTSASAAYRFPDLN